VRTGADIWADRLEEPVSHDDSRGGPREMISRPPNISLQRTAPCGLAAELEPFAGGNK
jgi:hypothetical protein